MAEQSSPIRALALLLALSTGCDRPLAETLGLTGERWLLSGHAPPVGATVETTYALSLHDGEAARFDSPRYYGSVSMEARTTVRETYLTATEKERIVVEDQLRTVSKDNGEEHTEEEDGPLVGVTVVGQANGSGGWTWRLKEGLPTEAQREALAELDEGASILPKEPVGIGDVWDVSAAALIGGSMGTVAHGDSGPKGFGQMKLVGLSERGGEPCAELRFVTGHLDLQADADDPESILTFDLEGSYCVSLNTGEELSYEAEGWLSTGLPSDAASQDKAAPFLLLGVVELTGSSRVTGPAGSPD